MLDIKVVLQSPPPESQPRAVQGADPQGNDLPRKFVRGEGFGRYPCGCASGGGCLAMLSVEWGLGWIRQKAIATGKALALGMIAQCPRTGSNFILIFHGSESPI